MENNLAKLNEELSALGLETINDVDNCPERTEYFNHLREERWDDEKWVKKLNALKQMYVLAFHNYFAQVFPHLRYEVGEDKVYWNYNTQSGVYDEINISVVRDYMLALLIREGMPEKATEAFAKVCLARYRAMYTERGSSYDDFDMDDEWFHASNGWVGLTTLEFQEHTPEKLSRRKSAVAYDANALCPVYDKFLDEDLKLKADQVRVIDQFSGLCLTNDIRYQKMLTLIGRPGCGKSTLLNCWSDVLGDTAVERKLTELQGESMRFAGSSFVGARLCWFDEVDVKKAEMGNTLGTLITGNTFNVERKGVTGIIKARNTLKCVLTANKLPMNAEVGIYRRLIMINIDGSFVDDGTVLVEMPDILREEDSGILNRMIRGLQDLRKMRGFTLIAGHEDLIEEYKAQSDTIAEFLDTFFMVGTEEDFIETDVLLASYRHFTEGNSWTRTITPRKFGKMLATQPLTKFRNIKTRQKYGHGRGWVGLKVSDEYIINTSTNLIESKISSEF